MKINMSTYHILKLIDYSDLYFMFDNMSQEFKIMGKKNGECLVLESTTVSSILDQWNVIMNFEKEDFFIDLYVYNKAICRYRTNIFKNKSQSIEQLVMRSIPKLNQSRQELIIEAEKERLDMILDLTTSIDKKIKL